LDVTIDESPDDVLQASLLAYSGRLAGIAAVEPYSAE